MKRITDARYWILDAGFWILGRDSNVHLGSCQHPATSIQNRLGGTTSDDEKLHRETIEKLGRRR